LNKSAKKTIKVLGFTVFGMFFFSFALVPLYDVFCEVTGLNGKVALESTNIEEVDTGREIKLQFISHNNEEMPWIFKPSEEVLDVKTGKYYTTTFYVKNVTNREMTAQAIPSVAPSNAASHLSKLECFCFNQQTLKPGEEALLPVKFLVDTDLPNNIKSVAMSYTIFDITDYDKQELAMQMNHDSMHSEESH
jgi:cytochrome c oxidase assembly protein subunit 11